MTKEPYTQGDAMVSGETVTPGEYRCRGCGETFAVEQIRNLPVCPQCQGEEWDPA